MQFYSSSKVPEPDKTVDYVFVTASAFGLGHNSKIFIIMPNRRNLKRTINNICSDVFAECVATSLYHLPAGESNVDAILTSILAIRNDFISRISHPEPGMRRKKYYDSLANSFSEQITEVIDQISNLH